MNLRKDHWDGVYRASSPLEVSWYQDVPKVSLELISRAGFDLDAPIIDVGGGASRLVDRLLASGHTRLAVLDISRLALDIARRRLGNQAGEVEWFEADVTRFDAPHRFALWHDRAVFHFLTEPGERQRYVQNIHRALQPGGQLVLATFAPDGPSRCSGLEVVRYDADQLLAELGQGFALRDQRSEVHRTPAGREQKFSWFRLARLPSGQAD